MYNFKKYKLISFDCYGTLIDWEQGLGSAMRVLLNDKANSFNMEEALQLYASAEAELEQGSYMPYSEIMMKAISQVCDNLGVITSDMEKGRFVKSVGEWQPFPDSTVTLNRLQTEYRIALISNIDNDTIIDTQRTLDVEFDHIITAQQVKAYKPNPIVFEAALDKFRIHKTEWLHVAQSLYHDIAPARDLGIDSIWVNRRYGKVGSGATPFHNIKPKVTVLNLRELTALVTSQ